MFYGVEQDENHRIVCTYRNTSSNSDGEQEKLVAFCLAAALSYNLTVIRATPRQTIYISPGEEHWPGATPGDFMEHLAMLEDGDDPATTTNWLEHVVDDQYNKATEV